MSRKQEIYREILTWALPNSRNTLSRFHRVRWLRVLSRKDQTYLKGAYEVAQFVHNLYVSILEEEFIFHDIWFLNVQARAFIERNSDKTCSLYSLFAYYIQELFKIVPQDLRHKLEWSGPEGDFSWAAPKRGDEVS